VIPLRFLKQTSIIALVFFAWFTIGPNFTVAGQEDPLTQARQLTRSGNYEAAIALLKQFIDDMKTIADKKKNIAEAYYMIAKIFFTPLGDLQSSDENLAKAFEAYPELKIDESNNEFSIRVKKVQDAAIASTAQKEKKLEVIPKETEVNPPQSAGKEMSGGKRGFPLLLVLGGVALAGGLAALLLGKKSSSGTSSANTGSITVNSTPTGAKIYLDGSDTGKTSNATLTSVAAGSHSLKLAIDFYGKWEGTAVVQSNQTTTVNVTLAPYQYQYYTSWGSSGSGAGQLNSPRGLSTDSSGNVYVADSGNNRIQKFNSGGSYLGSWGSQGSGNGQFLSPYDVDSDSSGNVYVADGDNNRIQYFTSSGAYISQWGSHESGDARLNSPRALALDGSGNVYVADYSNQRIAKFSSSGAYLTKWGTYGTGDGQFQNPRGIAIDKSGNVYVSDSDNNRIQKFDSNGSFIAKLGTTAGLNSPRGIAVDDSGNIFMADTLNYRVAKISTKTTAEGSLLTQFGSQGSGNGQFMYPYGIAVNSAGDVFVSDQTLNKILVFHITDVTTAVTTKVVFYPSGFLHVARPLLQDSLPSASRRDAGRLSDRDKGKKTRIEQKNPEIK
jgi:DNA-binding beta-propeller fold protein YncE